MNKKAVTETVEDTSIKISQSDIYLDLNGTFLLNVIDPEEINYYWTSGNTNIICVLGNGNSCNVMGVGAGESYIRVRDDIGNEGICNVVVSDYSEIEIVSSSSSDINNYVEDVSEICLNTDKITLAPKGQETIIVSISPKTAVKTNPIYYASTDSSIVEVFEGGKVIARNVGFATVQVMCGNKSKSVDVEVRDDKEEKVERVDGINSYYEFTGREKTTCYYSIYPATLSYLLVSFTVENPDIASVTAFPMLNTAVITSKYPGSTTVIVECGGERITQFTIIVRELVPESMTLNIESRRGWFEYYSGLSQTLYFVDLEFTVSIYPDKSNAITLFLFWYHEEVNSWLGISWDPGVIPCAVVGEDGKTGKLRIRSRTADVIGPYGGGVINCYYREKGDIKKNKDFVISIPIRGAPEYIGYNDEKTARDRASYYYNDIEGRARLLEFCSISHAKE